MLGTNLDQTYDLQICPLLPWMAFSFCWWFLGCADAFQFDEVPLGIFILFWKI